MHLFDFNQNIFIKKYYLNHNYPVLYHKLRNWYNNNEVFLLLDHKLNLTQYYYDNDIINHSRSYFYQRRNHISQSFKFH